MNEKPKKLKKINPELEPGDSWIYDKEYYENKYNY